MNSQNPKMPEDNYLNRLDAYFVCDELTVFVHRMRELICHSQAHSRAAFLSCADDICCDFLETMDRGWDTLTNISEGLKP